MKKLATLLIVLSVLFFGKTTLSAQVSVQIDLAPPPLPVYDQPDCPADGYIWTPGYWAYGPDGYYWVPGVWMQPAQVGFLWTPGYWGFVGGYYRWNMGYWGPHVGFYGGVCYGHGYGGEGYYGGRWEGGRFRYNTAVSHVNTTIVHNTYVDRTVIHNTTENRASFNGEGGVRKQPSANEQVAMRENHVQPTTEQRSHEQTAGRDRSQLASENKGKPSKTAMSSVKEQSGSNKPLNSSPARQTAKTGGAPRTINETKQTSGTAQKQNVQQQRATQPTGLSKQQNNSSQNQAHAAKQEQPHSVAPKQEPKPQQEAHPQQHAAARPMAGAQGHAAHAGGGEKKR